MYWKIFRIQHDIQRKSIKLCGFKAGESFLNNKESLLYQGKLLIKLINIVRISSKLFLHTSFK